MYVDLPTRAAGSGSGGPISWIETASASMGHLPLSVLSKLRSNDANTNSVHAPINDIPCTGDLLSGLRQVTTTDES